MNPTEIKAPPLPEKWSSAQQRFEWHLAFLVLTDPFVHRLLMFMEKRESKSVPTMGVMVKDNKSSLHWNREFFDTLTDPEVRYVLTHEMMHLALHHCTKRRPSDPKQQKKHNLAADLAINSLIPENETRKMPSGDKEGMKPEKFGWPSKLSLEQYLQFIEDNKDDPKVAEALGKEGMDSHDGWGESDVLDEKVKAAIKKMAGSSKVWGSMSSDVKDIILAAQKSKVNWRGLLRAFIGQIPCPKRISTIKRPNKRHGWPLPGTKKSYTDTALVAVDTSGSMGDEQLSQIIAEINTLCEQQPVHLAMFDADITQQPIPFDRKKIKFEAIGRGGTSFHPIFELADKKRYNTVIVLTDGYAPPPEKPKHVKDVIWIIVDGAAPVTWGKIVHIESDKGYQLEKKAA